VSINFVDQANAANHYATLPRPNANPNPNLTLSTLSNPIPDMNPIGVASYGALGHVPLVDFQLFNFSGHFTAAVPHKL